MRVPYLVIGGMLAAALIACGPSRNASPAAARSEGASIPPSRASASPGAVTTATASASGEARATAPAAPTSVPAEGAPPASSGGAAPASAPVTVTPRGDLTRLPIGDGRVSTLPQVGSVYSCQQSFGGGGAFRDGPWIRGDGTFDLTAKLHVIGSNRQGGEFSATLAGTTRRITGNGLPTHPTGQFPVASNDPAYQYDRNPNTIRAQSLAVSVPARPNAVGQASCLPMGAIGVSLNGVVFFNALDALGRDAVAHEILDGCEGHPERSGQYHYHNHAACLDDSGTGHSPLAGYAFDGFGIFGRRGEGGSWLRNADLDACHGHAHAIPWDGSTATMYHYHTTDEYPYTLGCFRGTPVRTGP